MSQILAEVVYPNRTEVGEPKIAAWISGIGRVRGTQVKKLEALLPTCADMRYHNGTFQIEVDVPHEQRGKIAVHKLAKKIRAAILTGIGVKAGLCPVASSEQVLKTVRGG